MGTSFEILILIGKNKTVHAMTISKRWHPNNDTTQNDAGGDGDFVFWTDDEPPKGDRVIDFCGFTYRSLHAYIHSCFFMQPLSPTLEQGVPWMVQKLSTQLPFIG